MKKRFALVALPLALAGLGACSTYGYDDYGYGYGYDDYGYNTGYDGYGYDGYGYGGSSVSVGLSYHDAYYDSFYGPVYGGYWAPDGYFWYQSVSNGPYIIDRGRHFRRDSYNGFRKYRYQDHRGSHGGGNNWNGNRDHDRNPPLFSGQRDNNNRNWNRDNDNRRGDDHARNNRNPPVIGGAPYAPRSNPTPPQGGRDGRGRDDRGRDNGNNTPPMFGGQQTPRTNPTPPPLQTPRGDEGRGRGGDRERGNGNWNGGGNRNGSGSPPMFGGQRSNQQTEAAPPPPSQPSAPPPQSRGRGRGDDDNGGHKGRGRSRDD